MDSLELFEDRLWILLFFNRFQLKAEMSKNAQAKSFIKLQLIKIDWQNKV